MPSQPLRIDFGQGLDQNTTKALIEPPILSKLENAEFDKIGRLARRSGFGNVSLSPEIGNIPSDGVRLGSVGSQVLISSREVMWRAASDGTLRRAGVGHSYVPGRIPVVRGQTVSASKSDAAAIGSVVCVAWIADGIWWAIYDTATKAYRCTPQTVATATATAIRVCAVDDRFAIAIYKTSGGTGVVNMMIDATTGDRVGLNYLDATATSPLLDAFSVPSAISVALPDTAMLVFPTATTVEIRHIDRTGALVAYASTGALVAAAAPPVGGICCTANSTGRFIAWGGDGGEIYGAWFDLASTFVPDLPTVDPFVIPQTAGATTITSLAVCAKPHTPTIVRLVAEVVPSAGQIYTEYFLVDNAGASTDQGGMWGLNLQSKPWVSASGYAEFVLVGFESLVQGDVFAMLLADVSQTAATPRMVGRYAPREAGDQRVETAPASVIAFDDGGFAIAVDVKTKIVIPGGTAVQLMATTGVDLMTMNTGDDVATDFRLISAAGPGLASYSGGVPGVSDGRWLREATFAYGPERISFQNVVAAGNTTDGTHLCVGVYRATDANGNVVRSVPSIPQSVTCAAGEIIQATIPPLVPMFGIDRNAAVACDLYQTLAGDSGPYYYEGTATAVPLAVGSVTQFDMTLADANIGPETLYTDGGQLENVAAPPSTSTTIAQSRIFHGYRSEVWYSKQFIPNVAPGYSEQLVFQIDDPKEIVALAPLDDRPVVFTERSIYAVDGEGYNDNGNGSNYRARRLATEIGCTDPRSIVATGDGVFFFASPGIHLLGRDQAVTFIGQPVLDEVRTYPICVAAVHVADKKRIHWFLRNAGGQNRIVVYDYNRRQWGVWTNTDATIASAVCIGSDLYYLTTAGALRKSDNDAWADVAAEYDFTARTAWIKLGRIQGFQQVRRATILFERTESAGIDIGVLHDYDESTVTEAYSWSAAEVDALVRPQVTIHLRRQKCQSIAFELSDSAAGTAGNAIIGIELELEVKRGSARLLLQSEARK